MRPEQGIELAALLRVRERVLGPEHPGTLTTRNNLASLTGQAGGCGWGPGSARCAAARA